MKIYAIYYFEDCDYDYFMQREAAMKCGIDYIRQIGENEGWDPQEITSLIEVFTNERWAYDLCALKEIEVKE